MGLRTARARGRLRAGRAGAAATSFFVSGSILGSITVAILAYDIGITDAAGAVTIVALVASPTVYFAKKWDGERTEERRTTTNIYLELRYALESLDRSRFVESAISLTTAAGKRLFVMCRGMNHDFYDSLVYSGKINFLSPELQQRIQSAFALIKRHNEYLELTQEISRKMGEPFPKESYQLFEMLDEIECRLLEDIPKIMRDLERIGVSPRALAVARP